MPWITIREALTAEIGRDQRVLMHATDQTMHNLAACERFAQAGPRVTFATPHAALGGMVETVTRPFILDRLHHQDVRLMSLSQLKIDARGCTTLVRSDNFAIVAVAAHFDTFGADSGQPRRGHLHRELRGSLPALHLVGAAHAARRLAAATQQAYTVGRAL